MAKHCDIGIGESEFDEGQRVFVHVGRGVFQAEFTVAEAREVAAEILEWAAEAEKPQVVDTRPPRQIPAQAHPVFAGILAHIGGK